MTAICTVKLGDRTVVARVSASGEVAIGDASLTVTASEPGLFVVSDGERRWHVAVAEDEDGRWVSVDGQVAVLEVEAGHTRRPRKKTPRADAMMAPMPATVMSILVVPGQSVDAGETVVVLEAMKMELPVRAPRAGVVKTIGCAEGDLVQPGVALVELD